MPASNQSRLEALQLAAGDSTVIPFQNSSKSYAGTLALAPRYRYMPQTSSTRGNPWDTTLSLKHACTTHKSPTLHTTDAFY